MVKEKEQFEEKRYAIISKELIKSFGESSGHADISDEVAALLAEDVVYRLREATQKSCQFMRHAKRKRLTSEDFNKAARISDISPFFGYNSPEPLSFRFVKDGELHFVEDHDINLGNVAFSSQVPASPGEVTVKAQWLAMEGIAKNSIPLQHNTVKNTEKIACGKLPSDLQNYWDNMNEAILGTDEDLTKCALADLKMNPRIQPILPHFVNFISIGVKTVSHDITQLSKLLHTVKAIVNNKYIFLELQPYLDMLIQAVLYCLLEPLAASMLSSNDHWVLRDNAAQLLNHISCIMTDSMNQLQESIVKALKDVLLDHSKPFCSHYGAVVGLAAFGSKVIEESLLPHLENYWIYLSKAMEEKICRPPKVDAFKVCGAILLAAENAIRSKRKRVLDILCSNSHSLSNWNGDVPIKSEISSAEDICGSLLSPLSSEKEMADEELNGSKNCYFTMINSLTSLYMEISSYFGDAFSARFPPLHITNFYSVSKDENLISLSDEFTDKTGEEMLEKFMISSEVSGDCKPLNTDIASDQSSQTLTEESYDDEQIQNMKSTEVLFPPNKKIRVERQTNSFYEKKDKDQKIAHVFDQKHRLSPVFVFNYAGCIQESKPRRKPFSLHTDTNNIHTSELYLLHHKLKKIGSNILSKCTNSRKNKIRVNLSSLAIVL